MTGTSGAAMAVVLLLNNFPVFQYLLHSNSTQVHPCTCVVCESLCKTLALQCKKHGSNHAAVLCHQLAMSLSLGHAHHLSMTLDQVTD